MITVFERIPDYFIERYNDELCAWGKNFAKIGVVKSIMLREGVFSDSSPNEEQGAKLMVVRLLARMSRQSRRVTVCPFSDMDEQLIAKHCEKMARLNISPRALLSEPKRPWLPFMPRIDKFNGG
jgi:hypothetical protein